MKPEYEPKTVTEILGYLVEECGEVMQATGKTIRWGAMSYNPELPKSEREFNGDWMLREMLDLEEAIKRARKVLELYPQLAAWNRREEKP